VELGADSSVNSAGYSRKINAYQLCDFGEEMHPFLGGSLGSFAVLADLKARKLPETSLVNVMEYRRLLLLKPLGQPSDEPSARFLTPKAAQDICIDTEYSKLQTNCFYAAPIDVKNILRQYERKHRVADLLRFLAAAVRVGVIKGSEVEPFLMDRFLIPGGIECGVSQVQLYINVVEKLKAACLSFLEHDRPSETDPYQIRALNFCSERLGSYLLRKEFSNEFGLWTPNRFFGHIHVISKGSHIAKGT
jgi:hypothetical protein